MIDIYDIDTSALYLAICTRPFGESIFVLPDGSVYTRDGSLTGGIPEDWLYYGKAEGDFNRDDWGVSFENGSFHVANLSSGFNTEAEALEAAINAFGLSAETIDDLREKAAELLNE